MSKKNMPATAWSANEFLKTSQVRWYAEDVFVYENGLYIQKSRQYLRAKVHKFLVDILGINAVNSRYVNDVADSVKHQSFLDDKNQPPFWTDQRREENLFVTSNTILRLDPLLTGGQVEQIPHSPDLFALCGVPYAFDPQASCPKWLAFLEWMVNGNQGEVQLLQQFCAWIFVARQLKLEKILWLCGSGGNGKSTFMRIARYVVGESATSAVGLEAFGGGESFRLWPTLHKLANFCNDAQVKRTSNVAALNAYVSGDPMTFNRKFREQLTVEPSTVCLFASNPMPAYADASDAFWRRLLLIQCCQRLKEHEIDPTLIDQLKEEAPGILNWALAAIPTIFEKKGFDIPASVRANVEELKSQANAARQFISEKMTDGDPDKDWLTRDSVMSLFHLWCEVNGFRREDSSVMIDEIHSKFNQKLTRRRKGIIKSERVHVWMGIRWRPEENMQDMDHVFKQNTNLEFLLDQKSDEIEKLQEHVKILRNQIKKAGNSQIESEYKNDGSDPTNSSEPPQNLDGPNSKEQKDKSTPKPPSKNKEEE